MNESGTARRADVVFRAADAVRKNQESKSKTERMKRL